MPEIAFSDGKVVMVGDKVGTGPECCCGATAPCSCLCSCDLTITAGGQEILRDDYSGSNPHPECDYFNGVFRICVADNTDAGSLADGYDKVIVTAVYTLACYDSSATPWSLTITRSVGGLKSATCDIRNGEQKVELYTWNCGADGCPTGAAVLLQSDIYQNDPGPPQSWLDNECYADAAVIAVDCNPFP